MPALRSVRAASSTLIYDLSLTPTSTVQSRSLSRIAVKTITFALDGTRNPRVRV